MDRLLAAITCDFDGESVLFFRRQSGSPKPFMNELSLRQFGPQVGMRRVLEMASRLTVPLTVFVPGRMVDRYPDLVKAIHDGGHELGLHGYDHEDVTQLTVQEEQAILSRSLETMGRLGSGPFGYRSPIWALNPWSLKLLLDAGVAYDSSLMNQETPFMLQNPDGRLLPEIPIQWTLDDMPYYRYIPTQHDVRPLAGFQTMEIWEEEIRGLLHFGGVPVLTIHPYLSGRAGRLRALEDLLTRLKGEGITFVSLAKLAAEEAHLGPVVPFPSLD